MMPQPGRKIHGLKETDGILLPPQPLVLAN